MLLLALLCLLLSSSTSYYSSSLTNIKLSSDFSSFLGLGLIYTTLIFKDLVRIYINESLNGLYVPMHTDKHQNTVHLKLALHYKCCILCSTKDCLWTCSLWHDEFVGNIHISSTHRQSHCTCPALSLCQPASGSCCFLSSCREMFQGLPGSAVWCSSRPAVRPAQPAQTVTVRLLFL